MTLRIRVVLLYQINGRTPGLPIPFDLGNLIGVVLIGAVVRMRGQASRVLFSQKLRALHPRSQMHYVYRPHLTSRYGLWGCVRADGFLASRSVPAMFTSLMRRFFKQGLPCLVACSEKFVAYAVVKKDDPSDFGLDSIRETARTAGVGTYNLV
ncbi:hypothetical protein [Mesorhizobium sp. M0047]|uniref:hypothetical protein n=1 Tax=Mesorhizobium sp. M0047 TaxID=2956859 RepID=UPI00333719FC